MSETILNGPGPRLSPEFAQFLGGLAAEWSKLPPGQKLDLHYKFRAAQERADVSRADTVRNELQVRKGSDESTWTAQDRLRLRDAHAQDGTKVTPQADPPHVKQAKQRRNELLAERAKIPYRSPNGVPGSIQLQRQSKLAEIDTELARVNGIIDLAARPAS
jgi:hypothetical protein